MRQAVCFMKNEQQSQNLLLKVDPRSTFCNNFFNPPQMFLLRKKLITQSEKRDTLTKTCNETMLCDTLRVFVSRILPPLSALDYRTSCLVASPGWQHYVAFLAKKVCSHSTSLHPCVIVFGGGGENEKVFTLQRTACTCSIQPRGKQQNS